MNLTPSMMDRIKSNMPESPSALPIRSNPSRRTTARSLAHKNASTQRRISTSSLNSSNPVETVPSIPPQVRTPQRLPARKVKPSLPLIDPGLAHQRSSAVSRSERNLPNWPQKRTTNDRFIKENLDVFQARQDRASLRHQEINVPTQTRTLGDTLHPNPTLDSARLPEVSTPNTVPLRSNSNSLPLPRSLEQSSHDSPKAARESSSKEQKEYTIDEMYERWNQWEDEVVRGSL